MATYQTRNGSTRAIIRKVGFKPMSETFDTETEAREWAAKVEARMRAGLDPEGAPASLRTSVADYLDRYHIEHCVPEMRDHQGMKYFIDMMVKRYDLLQKPVGEFTTADAQALVKARRTGDKARGYKDVNSSTARGDCINMSGFFTWLIESEKLDLPNGNPYRFEWPPMLPPRKQRASDGNLSAIIKQLGYVPGTKPQTSKEWVAWCALFAVETALRKSNVLNLTWRQIDDKTILIPYTGVKNKDYHVATLSPTARAMLALIGRGHPDDLVVSIRASNYTKIWNAARKACGLENVRIHDLRREACFRASKYLPNAIELKNFTGHKRLESLEIYYQPDAVDLADRFPPAPKW